jgi:8-oxo-dGTP diphosphatase
MSKINKKEYTLGFLFSEDRQTVALIKKSKPDWQKGNLNGIGGKCEETDYDQFTTMRREFKEETGVEIEESQWSHFATIEGALEWTVYVFKAFSDQIFNLKTTTEEEVTIIKVSSLENYKHIPNLSWLIPMALDQDDIYSEINYK